MQPASGMRLGKAAYGGAVRWSRENREPQWANPPEADRGLGAGKGWQRGGCTVAVNIGRQSRAQRKKADSVVGRGWATSIDAALCAMI